MGAEWATDIEHIPFGMILKNGKKMSTRKGKVIFLEEVLDEAVYIAKKNILEKSPNTEDIDEISEKIGVGSVIFNDLKHERQNDIEFNLEDMLMPEGNTCLYIQYTNARINAILRKSKINLTNIEISNINEDLWTIIKDLLIFEETIENAMIKQSPAEISKYLLQLSRHFNNYYGKTKILNENALLESRLSVLKAVSIVLEEGLRLLGIQAPRSL